MAKGLTIKDAIKVFEERKGIAATEAEKVELHGMIPPIEKMDATLSTLKACKHLALSTNNIEKISSLSGMENLRILSLGRNLIKKIENLDAVADTLEELWISYNQIASLISSWSEIDKLAVLDKLEDLLLVGNPLYNDYKENNATSEYRIEVVKRLPNLKKLDGMPVDVDEREQANAARGA
ncbi:hypothetical protein Vafri_2814 [Volvox africanus]|uniref:Uncharacterized protein n=1 Tax=Volvox africanus TaxID=51714 RepID=A0A8J4EVQ2_9CHLO|nr:hypothetical protein Vafri_2814 [Volvox africanus]